MFNGPDEQLVSGLAMGADGGIGGTYGAMPGTVLKIYDLVSRKQGWQRPGLSSMMRMKLYISSVQEPVICMP